MNKKVAIFGITTLISGCMQVSQVGMEYVKATAVNTAYEMKASDYHTSMLINKQVKQSSECIGNAFRSYNDDGDYTYADVAVNKLNGENYEVIAKMPYNPKLKTMTNDFNVDQILFLVEVLEGTSGMNRVQIWYNPTAIFASDKIDLAKKIIAPCI
jgi:hypothetical protein